MPEPSFELWTLHEKVGKQRWKPAYYVVRYGKDAEKETKNAAKHLTQNRKNGRKYKAVRYVPYKNL